MQALIVASEQEERDFLNFSLRYAGFAVVAQQDIEQAGRLLANRPIDLIVFSCGEAEEPLSLLKALRQAAQCPVMVLAAPLTEALHCALLDAGADHVLERPVSHRLLSRYARLQLRRASTVPSSMLPSISARRIVLDSAKRSVSVDDRPPRRLTQLEFRLLYLFMTNPDRVLTVEELVERVWGYEGEGNRDLVRGLVRRLRRKIEPDLQQPRFIQNLPGVGYQFSAGE